MRDKVVWGSALGVVSLGILALTLQPPGQTMALSGWVRDLLARLGFAPTMHELRSGAHVPMYFVLGAVLAPFGRAMGWKTWQTVTVGCAMGALDECLKIALPTREFDLADLCMDCAGVAAAVALVSVVHGIRRGRALPQRMGE